MKQMAILLAVGQDMNARRSHVTKGATVTLNMHTVTLWEPGHSLLLHRAATALRLHAAVAGTAQHSCWKTRESSKSGHETDENSDNHALQ